jgi:hypothetical protein
MPTAPSLGVKMDQREQQGRSFSSRFEKPIITEVTRIAKTNNPNSMTVEVWARQCADAAGDIPRL